MKRHILLLLSLFMALCAFPSFAAAPLPAASHSSYPSVEIKTNQGTILLELYPDQAPKSVANFLGYVKEGFYNNTIFHRVIDRFMIQGGGFTQDMKEKATRTPIENEAKNGLKNAAGTLAMARTSDPHSATAQFYINLVDNKSLDYPSFDGWGYAVFGKVTQGFDVVQKIGKTKTHAQDMPVTPIIIESIKILPEKK